MKVIFVIVSLAGGGAERVISILANEFVQKGIDVHIMMIAGDEVVYQLDHRVKLACMGKTSGGSLKARLVRIKRMRQYFKNNKDAIIISFGPGTSFFAVVAALFLGHPMLISERNDPAICPHKMLRNLVYGYAKSLVFQTKEAMNCFPKRIRKRGVVIPNPIAPSLPKAFTGQRCKRIVTAGRLEEQKNHKMLIEAFAIFHKKFPLYSLHIYGEGSLRGKIEEQINRLGLNGCVILEGFSDQVTGEIREAAIFALSSNYEGISNALLEALAMGIPVVSTDCPIGGSALCIDDTINGILTPVGDANAFAKAMEAIAGNQQFAKSLSNEALKIREKYSQENISVMWIAAIEGMCNESN